MNFVNLYTLAVVAVLALKASTAWAGCEKDNDCKGTRICVENRCVDPAPVAPVAVANIPEPVAAPSLVSSPPNVSAPSGTAPAATVATAPDASGAAHDSFLIGKSWFYSVSLLAGANVLSAGNGSAALFQPVLSANVGTKVTPDIAAVGFYSSSLPMINGQAPLGLGTLGVGIGIGDRYRAMLGAGLTGALPIGGAINAGLTFGGTVLAHGSIPLVGNFGLHVEAAATFVSSLTFLQAGIGLGWQG